MRAHLEEGFLVAACLVGAICAKEKKEKNQMKKHKTKHKNLIRFKLVQNMIETN